MSSTTAVELSLAEHVCLALVAEGATHGWQLGSVLAPDGAIGRVWTLSRPLTYRALDQLVDKAMVARAPDARGGRRDRQVVEATGAGRAALGAWLDEPIAHLRDVRTDLLLKLVLRQRAGLAIEPLLQRQQNAFAERVAALTAGAGADDLVDLWRRESARAVRRFLAAALDPPVDDRAQSRHLRISARNQLLATITAIDRGEVMATVKATLGDGQSVSAVITTASVDELDLAHGDEVVVIVKSTEAMIAKP